MTEEKKSEKEQINSYMLKAQYVKNFRHYLTAAALKENPDDIVKGFDTVERALRDISKAYADEHGIKAITRTDDILSICFDTRNKIPLFIVYWLSLICGGTGFEAAEYTKRHHEACNILWREYIKRRKCEKEIENDEKRSLKLRRRKLCKLFRDGKYSDMFNVYRLPFFDNIPKQHIENIGFLISELFYNELNKYQNEYEAAALAYIMGRMSATDAIKENEKHSAGSEASAKCLHTII